MLFLTPDVFGSYGGIARHCKIALKALTAPETTGVEGVDLIALMDPRGSRPESYYAGPRLRSYTACGGSRAELLRQTLSRMLRIRYDVVITEHVNLSPLLLVSTLRSPRARRVTIAHGVDTWVRLPPVRRMALQKSTIVVSVSEYTANVTSRVNHVQRGRVQLVYNCLDPALHAESSNVSVGHRDNSILTVSRLWRSENSKGHFEVLRALPQVVEAIPDVTYHVVGDGDLRPDLQRATTELGLERNVRFLGSVSDSALRQYYRRCAAYVMPSKWEGFGLVFLEAMVAGQPVIAGDRDATPEIVGDAALLVDPDDARGLADAIIRVLSDDALRKRLGAAGRARVESLFTYDRFRDRFLSVVCGAAAC
ncbi:MAG: glycosyltransferase family 4 protein [Chloroflexi bacterium]|nr:glycosyltransferase family 4 protein [Chloroflexota bacterium]